MKRVTVSSCGTSLLTNDAPDEVRKLLTKTANALGTGLSAGDRAAIDARIEQVGTELLNADAKTARHLSAELNGLLGVYEGHLSTAAAADTHWLLHTDTYQGERSAGLIEAWLRAQRPGISVNVYRVDQLTTRSREQFHWGMHDLVKWCEETLPGYRHGDYHVVFNLVGGFKSVQGYLNTLGMIYADEIVYVFEGPGAELISIPRLPIQLDPEGMVGKHLDLFRRMAAGGTVPASETTAIPESLLFQDDGGVRLSVWGEAVWGRCRERYYGCRLLDSPSQRVRYAPSFGATVEQQALEARRIVQVNERVDDLVQHLAQPQQARSRGRLDLKPVRNPKPGWHPKTLECDAWTDGSAKRLFGHMEGAVFVLERLDDPLH